MFNSIFGGLGSVLGDSYSTGIQNAPSLGQSFSNPSLAQQQMNAYASQMAQQFIPPKWVVNGHKFKTSKEFAEHIWPDDEQARLMFALKYPDD